MSEADSARPMPLRGRNGPSECCSRGATARARARSPAPRRSRRAAGVAERAGERLVERRGLEDLALQRRGGGEQPRVDVGERVVEALPVRALQQRGELQQLEVAHDAVGDVEVGVEPQLAEAPADARDGVEYLVAQQLERGLDLAVGVSIDRVCVRLVTDAVGDAGLRRRHRRRLAMVLGARLGVRVGHDGGEVAGEVADAGAGCAAHELGGERAQQLEAGALFGCVVGCEQRAPAARRAARSGVRRTRRARRLSSSAAALRCSSTKRWMRSRASGGTCGDSVAAARPSDEVDLAPPARDLDDARELDLAQLDGRSRQRAHDRGGVLRIDEQPQPGEHVAHLGALQKPTPGSRRPAARSLWRRTGPASRRAARARFWSQTQPRIRGQDRRAVATLMLWT